MNLPPVAVSPVAGTTGHLAVVLRRAWDQLAIYLPVILMGLLALLTYWMVRNTPESPAPQSQRPQTHEVDFFMRTAVIKTYDASGRLQNQLFGREMRHYADNATVEIDEPRWQGRTPQGRVTRASAQRALSKDDGSELQLIGQAVVVRDAALTTEGRRLPRQEFRGEFLQIFAHDERLRSHLPVEFTSGADRFSGDSFSYDQTEQVVQLQGRVKAQVAPSSERQR